MVSCTRAEQTTNKQKPPVRAATETVQLTTVTDHFQAPGTIRAKTQTMVSSKVAGQITSLLVREGDRVRQGQLLAEIEGRDASAQLRRTQAGETEARHALEEVDSAIRASEASVRTAEANRDLALSTRKRYEILRDRHSISPQEFDEIDARYRAAVSDTERAQQTLASTQAQRSQVLARIERAQAEVDSAGVEIGYLKIASPINGVVVARKAEPGMLATPGMPLLAIDDDKTYQLECFIEQSRAASVRIGQQASVEIDGLAAAVDARISEIVPASDPATRTYTVKLDLSLTPEMRRHLHSGFFGRASFPSGEKKALIAPESALVQRGQLTGIYTVREHAASLRLVKTGKKYEKGIEILSGLNPGDRIVIHPTAEITDGTPILEENPDGASP